MKKYLTVDETAKKMLISPRTIYNNKFPWCMLKRTKIDGRLAFLEEDIEDFIFSGGCFCFCKAGTIKTKQADSIWIDN